MTKPQTRLTAAQKASVCDYHKKNRGIRLEDIVEWAQKEFKLSAAPDRSTIGRIIKESVRYDSHANLRKVHVIPHKALEDAMATWVLQMEHRKICLSDDLIQKKARQLAV
jgi:hypothetical protein